MSRGWWHSRLDQEKLHLTVTPQKKLTPSQKYGEMSEQKYCYKKYDHQIVRRQIITEILWPIEVNKSFTEKRLVTLETFDQND